MSNGEDLEVKMKDREKHLEQWDSELTTRKQRLAGSSGSLGSQASMFSSCLSALPASAFTPAAELTLRAFLFDWTRTAHPFGARAGGAGLAG